MLTNLNNKLNSLSQIINIDNERGIIEYKSKDNKIKKFNIKEFVGEFSKNKDEKNKKMILPKLQNSATMTNLDDKISNTNRMNSTFFGKHGKKLKLKLKVNDNNNINNNNISNNNTINVIQSKKDNLLKQNEHNDSLIKFLDLLINMHDKDPNYFYNNNNIMNLVNNMNYQILKGEELCFIGKKGHKSLRDLSYLPLTSELKTKILLLEKKFLNALNSRLQTKLTGNEKKLNLNGKKLKNLDLELLFTLYSTGLEELDLSNSYIKKINEIKYWNASELTKLNLSNNKIKDITPLKDIYMPKCKVLDLSFNKIENITPVGELMKNNKELEIVKINNNRVKDVEALKLNLSKNIKDIILENNKIL